MTILFINVEPFSSAGDLAYAAPRYRSSLPIGAMRQRARKQSGFAPTLLSQNLAAVRSMVLRRVMATTGAALRWIARPPKVAFVMRLRPVRLLVQTTRQLPDPSTTIWWDLPPLMTRAFGAHRTVATLPRRCQNELSNMVLNF